jgi:hypothetical protein
MLDRCEEEDSAAASKEHPASKGWLCMWDVELVSTTIESLGEMANEERDALDIDSDSDEEKEELAPPEEESTREEVAALRREARAMLEKANALARGYNAGSTQRKLERRFDNGRSWVAIGAGIAPAEPAPAE